MLKEIRFSVNLSAAEVLGIYQGSIRKVIVISDTGLRVELNAVHFRPFTTNSGIKGRFRMVLDEQNRMQKLEKLV